jgi:hypothetical protein
MRIFNKKVLPIIVIDKYFFDTKFFTGKVLNKGFPFFSVCYKIRLTKRNPVVNTTKLIGINLIYIGVSK